MAQFGTDGSSTEDFRSVIDDLTVANKKLKQKLKRYEKLYDAHLQEEKLFEVRFHGLPDHKKKELEETLRKFASDLDDTNSSGHPPVSSYAPAFENQNTVSSTSRFTESGYASLSASGQASSGLSNQDKDRRKMSRSQYSRQQRSIQSYLHDIPSGLLPLTNAPMTEKAKKRLVVRRLEQVFAGKRSAPDNHQQPLQQQEVAQSAASADRVEREATGQHFRPEGLREARIMAQDNGNEMVDLREILQGFRPANHISEQDWAASGMSPDQRPTRPLDLDLHRAQVPGENMDYIRHLGFTPPNMTTGEAPLAGHGWMYLNLLINMAQLHTLNVTPDFVKDALHEYSRHLEVSRDGRKIRWKGGLDVTKNSGGSSSGYNSGASPDVGGSPSKRIKTGHSGTSSDSEKQARRIAQAKREKEKEQFRYKPIFYHREESDEEEYDYGFDAESSGYSLHQQQPTGNSSGIDSSNMQSSSSSKPQRRDDGPMIFYTKAKFCTDLSGDRLGSSLVHPAAYKAVTSHPLGAISETSTHGSFDYGDRKGPLNAAVDMESADGYNTSSGDDFGFSPDTLIRDSGNNTPELMDFEASGLGGVQPEDNFSIQVRRAQAFAPLQPMQPAGRTRRSSHLPQKLLDILDKQSSIEDKFSPKSPPQQYIKEELLSASRKDLPNSSLPPASFLPFDSTSSGDVDSDLDSDDPSSMENSKSGPTTALQLLNVSPTHNMGDSDEDESSEYSDESSDDGSIDLLATARRADPNTIRASEREYDAALADRLAEEIPAGSSAATAGGGSGFNTPAHGIVSQTGIGRPSSRKTRQSTTSGSLSSRTKNLKRSRTSGSMTTVLKRSKSDKSRRLEE